MRVHLSSLALLIAPTTLAVGVAAGLLVRPAAAPADLLAASHVTSAPVASQLFEDARQPTVRFAIDPDTNLTTTHSGRLTETSCRVGVPIESGQVLARADDQPVVALATSLPLYRDLARGAKGNDVSALQTELARLGFDVSVTGTFDRRTVVAVKALQKRMGTPKPSGALALADVVWLPQASVTPTGCKATVGATLGGDPLATVAGELRRISFDRPASLAPGDRTLTLFGQTIGLPADADGTDDPAFLAAVAGTREFAAQRRDDAAEVSGDYRLATPLTAWKVPPSALFGLAQGRGCVQAGDEAVPVVVVGSGLGASLVQTDKELTEVRVGDGITLSECEAER